MKKELSMQRQLMASPVSGWSFRMSLQRAGRQVLRNRLLRRLSVLYSRVMEQVITPAETLRLLHVQIAGACFLFPCGMSLSLRIVLMAWTGIALWQCRKIGGE